MSTLFGLNVLSVSSVSSIGVTSSTGQPEPSEGKPACDKLVAAQFPGLEVGRVLRKWVIAMVVTHLITVVISLLSGFGGWVVSHLPSILC